MPLSKVERLLAALVVCKVVGVVEGGGRIGGVVVAVVGASNGGPLSPRCRFTLTMSRGLPIIMPAAPDT